MVSTSKNHYLFHCIHFHQNVQYNAYVKIAEDELIRKKSEHLELRKSEKSVKDLKAIDKNVNTCSSSGINSYNVVFTLQMFENALFT